MKSKIPVPALLIAGLTATIGAVGLTLDIANGNSHKEMAIGFVTFLAYPAMGLLITRQQPRNAIGWLLLGIGLNTYMLLIDQDYAVFALIRHPGTLPAAQLFVAERRRLEKNMHDGAQQHLVALTVKLRLAATLAGRDPTKAHAALRGLEVQTANGLQTLRDLAQGIYPSALRKGGLIEALQVHAPVVATGVGRYDPEVEAGVYFCCLEALQNATKHAKAMQVRIKLEQQDGHLTFMVVDDGAGFDPQNTSTGAGLQNMQDRVASLGGQVSLESQPGKGTTVSGWFPVGARSAVTP